MFSRRILAGALFSYALSCAALYAQTTPSAPATPTPPVMPSAPVVPDVTIPAQASFPATPAPTPAPSATSAAGAPAPSPTATPAASGAPSAAPIPVTLPAAPKPKKKVPPPPPLETALSTDPYPTFQADTFFATEKAAEHYDDIVKAGGWPTDIVALRPKAMGPAVAELRKRLAIEGDLPATEPFEGPAAEVWDKELTASVMRFQARMGLRPTGIVAGATLKAINVPAEARQHALAASAQRIANSSFGFGDRYVVVNLPSTSVEAIENGRVAHRYVAIVGGPEHPSPEISAHISVVNLNPTWTVPVSIIKKEIIPRMQRDPGYLARQKIRILDGTGQEVDPKKIDWTTQKAANYTLRQDSGAGNSLGSIRIGMPNKLAVYMHDTPGKRLFGADYRFLSHGCVRVQGVYDYAEWLLQGTPNDAGGAWDKAALAAKVKEGARLDVKLTKQVPVIWVYLTGWSNDAGPANFRDDVYGLDTAPPPAADPVAATPDAAAAPATTAAQ